MWVMSRPEPGASARRRRSLSAPAKTALAAMVLATALRRFPKTVVAGLALRLATPRLLPALLASRPVARLLQDGLSRHPRTTVNALRGMQDLVRATRALHRTDWRLNLARAQLRSLVLDGSRSGLMERADFSNSSLVDVRFLGAMGRGNFKSAGLEGVVFVGCFLDRALFTGAKLEQVTMVGGEASRCEFDGAEMSHCTLIDMNLESSSFDQATLRDVVFERCDFTDVEVGQAVWEDVDFVDCRNLGNTLPPRSERRSALGATPRPLASRGGARTSGSIGARYGQVNTRSRVPLGYRRQTLARAFRLWSAWGLRLAFFGGDVEDQFVGTQYRYMQGRLRERYPALASIEFPSLTFVDGNRPIATYVDLDGEKQIVLSMGMTVLSVRLARYCIAWSCPPAISYMDAWPERRSTPELRRRLSTSLTEFAASRGDVSGLGRIQVSGRYDNRATCLGLTFLRFVLGHELAHFLQGAGVLPDNIDSELQADAHSLEMLREEPELDGDALLPDVAGDELDLLEEARFLVAELVARFEALESQGDAESEMAIADPPRFSSCDWHASAAAAFILALSGSAIYRDDVAPLARALAMVQEALGDQAVDELMREAQSRGSVLGMLQRAFDVSR
jgi:hypothetical protein